MEANKVLLMLGVKYLVEKGYVDLDVIGSDILRTGMGLWDEADMKAIGAEVQEILLRRKDTIEKA